MNKKVTMISSVVVICAIAILFLGCPPPVVRTRPPEPRVEYYGTPPYPDAVWRPGYWAYRGGGLGLDPRPLGKTSEALCPLGAWPLGTQRRGLVLDRWPLGVPIN